MYVLGKLSFLSIDYLVVDNVHMEQSDRKTEADGWMCGFPVSLVIFGRSPTVGWSASNCSGNNVGGVG